MKINNSLFKLIQVLILNMNKGFLQVSIAVMILGLSGLLSKLIFLPVLIIVFGRTFFAFISLFIFHKFTKKKLSVNRRDLKYLIVIGLVLAFHWFSFFESIRISTVAIGTLTFAAFPLFAAILEPIYFKDKFNSKDLIPALLVLIGVFILVPEFSLDNSATAGIIWGLLSAFTYTIIAIINKRLVKSYSGTQIAFYEDLFAAIFLLPFVFILDYTLDTYNLLMLILLGVIFTALGHSLLTNGLKYIKAKSAAVFASMEPVYAIFFAYIILNEVPRISTLIGGAIIIFAIYLTSKNQR